MNTAPQHQLEQVGTDEGLSFVDRLYLLVDQECLSQEQLKHERLVR